MSSISPRRTGRPAASASARTSADAAGPFVSDTPAPLVCQLELGGSIDPDAFRDADGRLYLYFKNDGNAVHKPAELYAQQLTPDGLGLDGDPVELLRSSAGKSWEQDVIEAPSMGKMGGTYVLFFSGGYFGWPPECALVALCDRLCDLRVAERPCSRARQPILFSRRAMPAASAAPATRPSSRCGTRWFLAYHAWSVTPGCRPLDPIRWLYISPMAWRDGKPVIGPTIRLPIGQRRHADVLPGSRRSRRT